ncbi:MAG: aspartate carbamoyltransferase [Thaumarchaeota archaeon]|nr:aspartate carbamoyltransferase [Nitrososphaerota archaeon]
MSRDAWKGRDVISILDFSRRELESLFAAASEFVGPPKPRKDLADYIVATAFFEPSTRTRLSFTTAALRLGAKVIDLSPDVSSILKGESLHDTTMMLEGYSDLIVMRHPSEGAALLAAELASVPVVNGGDGSQHHPTQAMLDLFTVKRLKGKIDGLTYTVLGDNRYARSATSFLYGLTKFKPKMVYIVSPETLRPRDEVIKQLKGLGLRFEQRAELEQVIGNTDVLYLTRIQKERFPDPNEYEKVKGSYKLTKEVLAKGRSGMIVLHPLPRSTELPYEIDSEKSSAYMTQAHLGVPLRMALLLKVIGGGRS